MGGLEHRGECGVRRSVMGGGEEIGMREEKCGEVSRIKWHLRDGILQWRLPKIYKAIQMNSQNNEQAESHLATYCHQTELQVPSPGYI